MVSPSVTGFSITIDSESGWSTPAAGLGVGLTGADITAFGSPYGNGMRLRGSAGGPGLYIAQISRSINLTALQGLTFIYSINQSQALANTASNGVLVGFADASNNYSFWRLRSSDQGQSGYIFSVVSGTTAPVISSATPADLTAINRVLVAYTSTETNATRPIIIWDQFGTINNVSVTDGDAGSPAGFTSFVDYFASLSIAAILPFNGIIVFRIPLSVKAEYFRSSDRTVVFETLDNSYNVSASYYSLNFELLTSTASQILNRITLISGSSLNTSFSTSGSNASATAQFNQVNVAAAGTTDYYAPAAISGGYESGRTLVRYRSGSVTNRELIDSPLQIDCAPGQNLSALDFNFSGTTRSLRLNPSSAGASQINLSGISSDGSLTIDNVTANNVTILVNSGLTYTVASPTAGGGTVTVIQPVAATTISGFPYTANSLGVLPAPVLGVFDASDGSFLDAIDTADTEYGGTGAFTIVAADYTASLTSGTSIQIVGDAVGWRRTAPITIDTSDPPSSIDISPAFQEYVDEAGTAFVGQTNAAIGLSYDQANARFELAAVSGGSQDAYDFAGVVYQQELLTSNKAGMENFDTSVIRAIQYILNTELAFRRIIIPGALKVAATVDAATNPIILDFGLFSLDDSSPYVLGLSSTATGLTIRPYILPAYSAPSDTVTVEGRVNISESDKAEIVEQLDKSARRISRRILGEVNRGV